MNKIIIGSESETQTEQIGSSIGGSLRGGECFELSGDLGVGKTAFTRGLVYGAGSKDRVASPTFVVQKQYVTKELRIYHFDFYRLEESDLVAEELRDALADKNGVIVVEWADSVSADLPPSTCKISIERVTTHADHRRIIIDYHEEQEYLLSKLEEL